MGLKILVLIFFLSFFSNSFCLGIRDITMRDRTGKDRDSRYIAGFIEGRTESKLTRIERTFIKLSDISKQFTGSLLTLVICQRRRDNLAV